MQNLKDNLLDARNSISAALDSLGDDFGYLTDAEYAVTIDALNMARDHIRANRPDVIESYGTPNIDSALAKLTAGCRPTTSGLFFTLNTPSA